MLGARIRSTGRSQYQNEIFNNMINIFDTLSFEEQADLAKVGIIFVSLATAHNVFDEDLKVVKSIHPGIFTDIPRLRIAVDSSVYYNGGHDPRPLPKPTAPTEPSQKEGDKKPDKPVIKAATPAEIAIVLSMAFFTVAFGIYYLYDILTMDRTGEKASFDAVTFVFRIFAAIL